MNRLAFSQGHELADHGGTAVALTPGWLRSEMMLEAFGVTEETWRDALEHGAPPGFAQSESPRYVGEPSRRWPPTTTEPGWNQQSRHRRAARRRSTASPTSTAPSPTPGA